MPGWPAALQAAAEILAEIRRSLRSDAPDVFVEKIRTLWLAEVTAAARYLGRFRRARLDRFLADLEATLVAGEGGDAGLARFLRQAVEEGGESQVPIPPDLETDAVHVMTIHKAKGLDFDHVYVAQIHKGGRGWRRPKHCGIELRFFDGHPEYRLFGWVDPGLCLCRVGAGAEDPGRMVRLLYVALTRAKNRLVVSGGWRAPGDDVPPEAASTFARLISRRLEAGAVERQIENAAERVVGEEEHVARLMPVLGRPPETVEPGAARGAGVEVPAEALLRASELAAARRAAAERMERTPFRSASAEAHDRLQRAEAEEGGGEGEALSDRGLAMALGTAVHSVMETLDLASELAPQIAAQRERILGELGFDDDGDDGKGRAEDLLTRLAGGSCMGRLSAVADCVVARELPVMLWSEEPGLPGAVVSGLVDLVYRDPDDGRVVVADYKTDRIDGAEALAERAGVYEPQVRTYASALRDALDLDHEPHVELWFLAADRIVRL